jgi:YidC/Oxa1 family membrane protein insertase
MDKKTGLTIIFLVVIFLVWSLIMQLFAPPQKTQAQPAQEQPPAKEKPAEEPTSVVPLPLEQEPAVNNDIRLEQGLHDYAVTFSNKGGVIRSVRLKDSNGENTEMVFVGDTTSSTEYPFLLHFGDYKTKALDAVYEYKVDEGAHTVEFSRAFSYKDVPFVVRKTYILNPDEYMFELKIAIENQANENLNLDFNGVMYTLSIGPQIGPEFKKLEGGGDYRKFVYYDKGRNERDVHPGETQTVEKSTIVWAAVVGKYYTLIVLPSFNPERLVFDSRELDTAVPVRSTLDIERPYDKTQRREDTYKIYIGPKKRSFLEKYNVAKNNSYGLKDRHLDEVVPSVFLIGFIADILKYPLDLFYGLVGNYGIAIILLTILIKVIVFPLTRKSYESMSRLQELSPKMTELREKYKDNPKKLNMEMADLYRREGVNPLGGCLPQLLQLPIMFALYILLQEHFGLRNAMFIPGWIPDLSAPEYIVEFNFTIPILNWQYLRLLPIIMLATQIISSKLTQTSTGTDSKMKMLPYILVGVFFFILYNLPSCLVLYWTVQNILTTAQMMVYKKYFKNRPPKPKKPRLTSMKSYMRR